AYMSQNYISVSVADSVEHVKAQLVNDLKDELIPTYLYVVDKDNYLNGILPVKSLLLADNGLFVSDIMRQTFFSVSPEQSRHDVYQLISQSGLDSVP
ncbi:CBS domain-containing protein, partial [Klebsiella aerogenes]|nr:CBS domain-containing protein [Klebsiella aerogenes]